MDVMDPSFRTTPVHHSADVRMHDASCAESLAAIMGNTMLLNLRQRDIHKAKVGSTDGLRRLAMVLACAATSVFGVSGCLLYLTSHSLDFWLLFQEIHVMTRLHIVSSLTR